MQQSERAGLKQHRNWYSSPLIQSNQWKLGRELGSHHVLLSNSSEGCLTDFLCQRKLYFNSLLFLGATESWKIILSSALYPCRLVKRKVCRLTVLKLTCSQMYCTHWLLSSKLIICCFVIKLEFLTILKKQQFKLSVFVTFMHSLTL